MMSPSSPGPAAGSPDLEAATAARYPQFFAAAAAPSVSVGALVGRALFLMALGGGCVAGIVALLRSFPALEACADVSLRTVAGGAIPRALGGGGDVLGTAAVLWRCADAAQRQAPESTLAVFIALYCGLQAFAIPGPLVLSIVAGALYGLAKGQLLIAACATSGATLCYALSAALARPLVERQFPGRLADLRGRVDKHKEAGTLPAFLLFLRLTPAVPNWFVNMASPIVGVPLTTFVGTTAVGLVAPNYFHAAAGAALAVALAGRQGEGLAGGTSALDATAAPTSSRRQFGVMVGLQAAVLIPVFLLRRRVIAAVEAGGSSASGKTS